MKTHKAWENEGKKGVHDGKEEKKYEYMASLKITTYRLTLLLQCLYSADGSTTYGTFP